MEMKWTPEQQKVIETRNANVLVSAAAGSGKTAVLVARILSMITDLEHPVSIDELLIVTFTRAAAGEMRERIRLAIETRIEEEEKQEDSPKKEQMLEHLRKQNTLLHHALITTIDSFCAYIVRNYFHLIDLDPSFRVGEEGELRMLQGDVAERILSEAYEEGSEEFHEFVEAFSTGRSDDGLVELIRKLYTFSTSYPYPKEWLVSCKDAYQISSVKEVEQAPWMQLLKSDIEKNLEEIRMLAEAGIALCRQEDGPYLYEEALSQDLKTVELLLKADSFEAQQEVFSHLSYARLSGKKMPEASENKKELVKNYRNQIKDGLNEIKEQYFGVPFETAAKYLQEAGGPVGVLIDLTLRFSEAFAEKKREKNLLDYSDLEHFALEILIHHTENGDERSEAAKELSAHFYEILIDEYQDSNLVQEKLLTAVSRMEEGQNNIFMVGDVKQSIYRFRLARPDLFMEKYHSYLQKAGDKVRIDLHKNFRSREEVLAGINFIFYQIMGESLGGVEYDEDAALYAGAVFEENSEPVLRETELLLVESDEAEWKQMETEENVQELEARLVADKIQEIVGKFPVVDKENGGYRKAEYGDIVILLRTMNGWAENFKKILESRGIPASVTTKTGYFSAQEVVTVLNYLRILDNPLQDIPFAGVLLNLPDAFTMEELAKIKCAGKESSDETLKFFECMLLYEKTDGAAEIQRKISRFLEQFYTLRVKVAYTPIHELLWDIYESLGLIEYYMANALGEQKKANLEMLFEKARDYEKTSYRGLFNFVRYIENLQKYQIDFGEADITASQENTVKIMSIHKSKGLEFPIVFVSGLGKLFNQQDARASLVIHPDLGIGADWIDTKRRTKAPTLLKKAVQRQIQLENLGEELRVLYVALTRAKEKLYLTGAVSRLEKRVEGLELIKNEEKMRLSYGKLVKARMYLDWIFPALARHRCMDGLYQQYEYSCPVSHSLHEETAPFLIAVKSPVEFVLSEAKERSEQLIKEQELIAEMERASSDERIRKEIQEHFLWEYPWQKEAEVPAKVTVSEVKRMQFEDEESVSFEESISFEERVSLMDQILGEELLADEKEEIKELPEIEPYIPAFMQEEGEVLVGVDRGNAYHKVLQWLDFTDTDTKTAVKNQLAKLREEQKIDESVYVTVKPEKIFALANSRIGKRMKQAQSEGCLFREQPFVIEVLASDILKTETGEETMLVQGIIDAFFEENGKIVLLDYKTDYVEQRDGSDLVGKYGIQLKYYQKALERMLEKPVEEKYIYSVNLERAFAVE